MYTIKTLGRCLSLNTSSCMIRTFNAATSPRMGFNRQIQTVQIKSDFHSGVKDNDKHVKDKTNNNLSKSDLKQVFLTTLQSIY